MRTLCLTALLCVACQEPGEPARSGEPVGATEAGAATLWLGGQQVVLQTDRAFAAVAAHSLDASSDVRVVPADGADHAMVRWETSTGVLIEADVEGQIALEGDQRLVVELDGPAGLRLWSVGLVPESLPELSATGDLSGDAFFFLAPHPRGAESPEGFGHYLMIVDGHGVPVWWRLQHGRSYDFRVAGDGSFAVNGQFDGPRLPHSIDPVGGEPLRTWIPGAMPGWKTVENDVHEIDVAADGSAVHTVDGDAVADLTAVGGAEEGALKNTGLQVRDPQGDLVASWSPDELIDITTLPPDALAAETQQGPWRYGHINCVESVEDGWVVSLRTPGEVVRVLRESGAVVWRLGGAFSDFTFVDDPRGGFFGQHSARMVTPDRIILFDNGTNFGSPATGDARFVEYELDFEAWTATLVAEHALEGAGGTDNAGSVQRMQDGRTVINWGSTTAMEDGSRAPTLTVLDAAHQELGSLALPGNLFTYRVWAFGGDPILGLW
jgi:hypothetical protein